MTKINIFTDGAGYIGENGVYDSVTGFISFMGEERLHHGREYLKGKTNNYAEMRAILDSLLWIKSTIKEKIWTIDKGKVNTIPPIRIYSDSALSVNSLNTWIHSWVNNIKDGKMCNSQGKPVANQELIWETYKLLYTMRSFDMDIIIYYIPAHVPKIHLSRDTAKFNKFNNLNITVEEFTLLSEKNSLCDLLVKYNEDVDVPK